MVYNPPPATPAKDRTTVFGVIGIVGAFCCLPIGFIFGILSVRAARRVGKPPTLGYIAIGFSAVVLVIHLVLWATGAYSGGNNVRR